MALAHTDLLKRATIACRSALYVAAFFSFFINILMLTTAIYMLQIYDRVLGTHSYDTLIFLTLITIVALMILALLDTVRSRILVHIGTWIDSMLSPTALAKSPDQILSGQAYGPQALRDITNVRQFVSGAGIIALFDMPWLPIYLIVIFMLHPALGLVATLGALVLFTLAVINERATKSLLAEANGKAIIAQSYVESSLRNAEVIQSMGMMGNIIHHWQEKNKPVIELQTIASNRAGAILAISKFARLTLQILILGVGAFFVLKGDLTGGAMIAASILMGRALAPIEQAIGTWKQLLGAREAYERLQKHFASDTRLSSEIQLPRPTGDLLLENVGYKVATQEKPILLGVSIHLKAGDSVALIGPSGAGKSTLARLIVGAIKPSVGHLRLDGADIYNWNRDEFGKYIGYLPQDVELFTGTVKDNIARMGKIDDEAVIEAAKLAGVHDLILHLPHGYDTPIKSNSYTLSGGQRQRVALARAFYKNPALIILDEPNANLDHEGEVALAQALDELRKRKVTIIIIAHRPSVVTHVDNVMVLAEGKILMAGPREQVLAKLQEKQS